MAEKYSSTRPTTPAGTLARRRRVMAGLGLVLAAVVAIAAWRVARRWIGPVVVIPRAVMDSMNAAFLASNLHWNELRDLNTLERMLGTVRPTQREYLGCLQGIARRGVVQVDGWSPARDMKQLQMAVAGTCDGVPRLVGTWHTHPYHADPDNRPLKERILSARDLETFRESGYPATIVVWDVDSLDAAVRLPNGIVRHPVSVVTE